MRAGLVFPQLRLFFTTDLALLSFTMLTQGVPMSTCSSDDRLQEYQKLKALYQMAADT